MKIAHVQNVGSDMHRCCYWICALLEMWYAVSSKFEPVDECTLYFPKFRTNNNLVMLCRIGIADNDLEQL